jgi:hypothetical protein
VVGCGPVLNGLRERAVLVSRRCEPQNQELHTKEECNESSGPGASRVLLRRARKLLAGVLFQRRS